MGSRLPLACLVVVVLAGGCGKSGPEFVGKLVPVSGEVTLDGKALGGADVAFIPVSPGGHRAFAASDSEGRFELTTVPSGARVALKKIKGALPGTYRVSIIKFQMRDGSAPPRDAPPMESGAVDMLPPQYATGDALSATVSEQGGKFKFELKSKR